MYIYICNILHDTNIVIVGVASKPVPAVWITSGDMVSEAFSKLNWLLFGFFHPVNILFDNTNKFFSGWPNRNFGFKSLTERKTLDKKQKGLVYTRESCMRHRQWISPQNLVKWFWWHFDLFFFSVFLNDEINIFFGVELPMFRLKQLHCLHEPLYPLRHCYLFSLYIFYGLIYEAISAIRW